MRRWCCLGGLALLAGLVAFVVTCGRVTAVEFSPWTFAHRSVTYYEVPIVELRVTPVWSREWRTPLAEYLADEGFVTRTVEDPGWQHVKGFKWGVRGWHGSAKYLCRELGCWSGGDDHWVAWSRARPGVARGVWPAVIAVARSDDCGQAAGLVRWMQP